MKKLIVVPFFVLFAFYGFGQYWSPLGNGVIGDANAMAMYQGELYVGGSFSITGNEMHGLMKWNGTTFDTVPGNYLLGKSRVWTLKVFQNELYLGGGFCPTCNPSNSNFNFVAKWNGTSFSAVGSGFNNQVFVLEEYNGELYAGGDMSLAGNVQVNGISKWDGNQWQALGNGINQNGRVTEMAVYNNELYVAGNFRAPAANNTYCIARWNGSIWQEVGPGGIPGIVTSLATYGTDLYAGGAYFTTAGGVAVNQIAQWNGTTWAAVGSGIGIEPGGLEAMAVFDNQLVAAGAYFTMDGDSLLGISRYNGLIWDSLGSGLDSIGFIRDTVVVSPGDTSYEFVPAAIYALLPDGNDLYACGYFTMIGGVTVNNIAKWTNLPAEAASPNLPALTMFPNPASDNLHLQNTAASAPGVVQIFDCHGKCVYQNLHFKGDAIDVHQLENGTYVMQYTIGQKRMAKKFVVCH